jgi:hypothetical protein
VLVASVRAGVLRVRLKLTSHPFCAEKAGLPLQTAQLILRGRRSRSQNLALKLIAGMKVERAASLAGAGLALTLSAGVADW